MAKVMNIVFGIGIAIILFIVVLLGTQVFYEEPVYEDFCNSSYIDKPVAIYDSSICSDNITVKECNALVKEKQTTFDRQQAEIEKCQKNFTEAQNVYGKKVFIINNVAGIIFVIVSLFLFSIVNIAAGTAFAGLVLIIYGFMRGWQGIGDVLKFIVALIVAILFIYFAVIVNKRYNKSAKKNK
jgi:hypothetical protein